MPSWVVVGPGDDAAVIEPERGALDVLKVERIDHGVRCVEDPALVRRLAAERVPLTVCPLSNVKLCVYPSMDRHHLAELLEAGLCATVNSDDPAYFGGYLGENWLAAAKGVGLSREELVTLARNSFTGSFLTPAEIAQHLAAIEAYAATGA